ncbi:MAG: Crp/Fnr family transcriptional regulator [Chitinophagales bacterium]
MNAEMKYIYLSKHSLAAQLNEEQIRILCDAAKTTKANKGEIIQYDDGANSRIYLLIQGKAKITEVDESGNEFIKEIVNEGDLFGKWSLENGNTSDEYAEVLTENTILCSFDLKQFAALMQQLPILILNYARLMNEKLRRLENRHSNLVFKDVKTRLIYFFKDWAKTDGNQVGNKVVLKNYLTHSDIAAFISTSRQSVTGLLNEFKETGILSYSRKQIELNSQGAWN